MSDREAQPAQWRKSAPLIKQALIVAAILGGVALVAIASASILTSLKAQKEKELAAHLGYIDKTGKTLFNAPLWSISTRPFKGGLAGVRLKSDEIGYLDKSGKLVFTVKTSVADPPDGPGVYDFSEELVPIKVAEHWGYADKSGRFTIQPQYDDAQPFSQGLAAVRKGGYWGFIDHKGTFVIERQFQSAMPFSEDLAAVMLRNKIGYIDKKGIFKIQPQFDLATRFSEGLAYVDDSRYIDRQGKNVIDLTKIAEIECGALPPDMQVKSPNDNLLFFYLNRCSVFETRDRVMSSPKTASAHRWFGFEEFHNGWTICRAGSGRRFLDKHGNFMKTEVGTDAHGHVQFTTEFLEAKPFSEGVAAVNQQGKYRFVDARGQFIMLGSFDDLNSFHDGLAQTKRFGRVAFIDHQGRTVCTVKEPQAKDFSEGLAQLKDHL